MRIFGLVGQRFVSHAGVVQTVGILCRLGIWRRGLKGLQSLLPQACNRLLVALVQRPVLFGQVHFNGLAGVYQVLGNFVYHFKLKVRAQFGVGGWVQIFAAGATRHPLPGAVHGALHAL